MAVRSSRAKPEVQQLIAGMNTRLTVASQDGALQNINPSLQLIVQANDAIREMRWFRMEHVMVALKIFDAEFAEVPVGEIHRYHQIMFESSSGDQREAVVEVLYPAQGELGAGVSIIAARKQTGVGAMAIDLLGNPGTNDGEYSIGRPLDVFPGGILSVITTNTIPAAAVVTLGLLWEIGAAPLSREAEALTPTITEV